MFLPSSFCRSPPSTSAAISTPQTFVSPNLQHLSSKPDRRLFGSKKDASPPSRESHTATLESKQTQGNRLNNFVQAKIEWPKYLDVIPPYKARKYIKIPRDDATDGPCLDKLFVDDINSAKAWFTGIHKIWLYSPGRFIELPIDINFQRTDTIDALRRTNGVGIEVKLRLSKPLCNLLGAIDKIFLHLFPGGFLVAWFKNATVAFTIVGLFVIIFSWWVNWVTDY